MAEGDGGSGPEISVVVPVRDREGLLGETLDSVQGQTFGGWECIVVDDGSGDGTVEVAECYVRGDGRFQVHRRWGVRGGAPVCRNQGFARCRAPLVVFLDSDDLLEPGCLGHRVAFMSERPELAFAVFGAAMFRSQPGDLGLVWNAPTGEDPLLRFVRGDGPWQTGCAVFRRLAVEAIGPWDEGLRNGQDNDFFTRALVAGLPYVECPEVDLQVRAAGGRESIGAHFYEFDYLRSQLGRVRKLDRLLEGAGLLGRGSRLRRLVAGNYFWVAEQFAEHFPAGSERSAAWRECRDRGLVGGRDFLLVAAYLRLRPTRLAGPLLWLLDRLLPPDLFVRCHTVPGTVPAGGGRPKPLTPADPRHRHHGFRLLRRRAKRDE